MLTRIKTIVTRSPNTILADATGLTALTSLFILALHLPAMI